MRFIRLAIVIVVVSAVLVAGYYLWQRQWNKMQITTFEQCADAGYPVQESFPEVCRTPDGQAFTQSVE